MQKHAALINLVGLNQSIPTPEAARSMQRGNFKAVYPWGFLHLLVRLVPAARIIPIIHGKPLFYA